MSSTGSTKQRIIGTFSNFRGVTVSFEEGEACDYLRMRAAQVASLTLITSGPGFDAWSDVVKDNLRWLLSGLAEEVEAVIPIALHEAQHEAGQSCTRSVAVGRDGGADRG
jgi:hypothetical protein